LQLVNSCNKIVKRVDFLVSLLLYCTTTQEPMISVGHSNFCAKLDICRETFELKVKYQRSRSQGHATL